MGTESVHVEVTRFDLVLNGVTRERVSEGFKEHHQILGPRGDGSRNTKSMETIQEKKTGKLTGQRSDQWMLIDTQKETKRSAWSYLNLWNAAGQRDL